MDAYCVPTSVTLPGDEPSTLSYTIARATTTSNAFSPFTVSPVPCNINYQMTVSPALVDPSSISFDALTRQISVQGSDLFIGGDHNSGSYVPGVYSVEIRCWADNSHDTGVFFTTTVTIVDPCKVANGGTLTIASSIVNPNPVVYTVDEPADVQTLLLSNVTPAETTATCPPIELDVTD